MPVSKLIVTELKRCGRTLTLTTDACGIPLRAPLNVYRPGASCTRKRPSLPERNLLNQPVPRRREYGDRRLVPALTSVSSALHGTGRADQDASRYPRACTRCA